MRLLRMCVKRPAIYDWVFGPNCPSKALILNFQSGMSFARVAQKKDIYPNKWCNSHCAVVCAQYHRNAKYVPFTYISSDVDNIFEGGDRLQAPAAECVVPFNIPQDIHNICVLHFNNIPHFTCIFNYCISVRLRFFKSLFDIRGQRASHYEKIVTL